MGLICSAPARHRVVGTVEDWRKFLDLKEELRAMAAAVTGVEASGSLEDPA